MNKNEAFKANPCALDLRKTLFCILLIVIPDTKINEDDKYHDHLIYYPIERIVGVDPQEVKFLKFYFV